MLSRLLINNIAIIDKLIIEFDYGLNIITGTTGSGKSIIINSISYLLGKKFNKNLIRTGESKAYIEGDFIINERNYTLSREFTNDGRNLNFINGKKVSLKDFKELSSNIVDMHGQHEHHKLLNQINHINYLDLFGNYDSELNDFKNLFQSVNMMEVELKNLIEKSKLHKDMMDLYNFQLEEIGNVDLDTQVEKQLNQKFRFMVNAKEIKEQLLNISRILSNDSGSIQLINNSLLCSQKLVSMGEQFHDIDKRLKSIMIEMDDLSAEVQSINGKISLDKTDLERIESKIKNYEEIKRKYGGTIDNVIKYKKKILSNINVADISGEDIRRKKASIDKMKKKLDD